MATDGGVFTFGSAQFHGSTGAMHLNAPVVGMAATPNGGGYLLVASDGGVFTFGNAHFHGSTGDMHVTSPVVGMAGDSTGGGYWLATQDGSVFNFGDAKNEGGAKQHAPADPPDRADHERSRQRRLPDARAARADRSSPRRSASARPGAAVVGGADRGCSRSATGCPASTGVFDAHTQQAVYAFQKSRTCPAPAWSTS